MKNSEIVYATAILKAAASGKTSILTSSGLTTKEIQNVNPSASTKKNGIAILQKLGFVVNIETALMLSISGSKALFEKTFSIKLKEKIIDQVTYYEATNLIIPEALEQYITAIVFAEPIELF